MPVAGDRELLGVTSEGTNVDRQLDKDCGGVATLGPVLGAQDTGGADITRTLVKAKAGKCTLHASALGVSATKTVELR